VKAAAGRASVRVARGSEMGQGGARGSGGRRGCSEWVAVVACHNGGGGGRFGRGLAGVVVGSDEGGGLLRPLRERKGRREAVRAHARQRLQSSVQGGRRLGRARESARGGGWLAGPAGLKAVTGPTQEEKNPLQISFKFCIWQNFAKLYKEILMELNTRIFPKIF
jgi:hypothetical protein